MSLRNKRRYIKQRIDRESEEVTRLSCKFWRHLYLSLTDRHVFSSSRCWNCILTFDWRKKKRNFISTVGLFSLRWHRLVEVEDTESDIFLLSFLVCAPEMRATYLHWFIKSTHSVSLLLHLAFWRFTEYCTPTNEQIVYCILIYSLLH